MTISEPLRPTDESVSMPTAIDLTDGRKDRPRRPMFTITDAASACGVSRKTITRKLADLGEHGAAKDEDGIWRIPVEALLAIGLHPGRSLPAPTAPARTLQAPRASAVPEEASSQPVEAPAEVVSVPRAHWDDLRIRLARAEAQASERSLALADARLALRALTAGPAVAPSPTSPPSSTNHTSASAERAGEVPPSARIDAAAKRKRWWHAQ
jgi:hypothetical protein